MTLDIDKIKHALEMARDFHDKDSKMYAALSDAISETKMPVAQWRAFYNVSYPKLWGIETSDLAAHAAGLEIVVAPCMPEHAAKDIASAWNARTAPSPRSHPSQERNSHG